MLKKVIICAASLILTTGMQVFASSGLPNNVILEGNSQGIVFISGDEPFLMKEGILPGDIISRNIIIDNEYHNEYEVFMRAERVSEEEQYDLLDKLELTIHYNDSIIYNGPATGEDYLSNNISLGKFKPGEEETLYAEVTLDGNSIGNEYKDKYAQVDWIFTAISEDNSDPTLIDPNYGNQPTTTNKNPNTGDSSVFIYGAIAIVGILVLFALDMKKIINRGE